MDSPFNSQPPIYAADFAFIVIFACVSCGQLVLALLLTGMKMTRKPDNAFGTATEQEAGLLRLHRIRFALLMTLTLISVVVMYSMQAALFFPTFLTASTYIDVFVAGACLLDIQNVFLSAVLVAVLDSGIKVSQLSRHSSTVNALQGGTNVNIVVMSCLVAFLMILTIARIAVLGLWSAAEMSNDLNVTTTTAEGWAQLGLSQVRIFINLVFAIYYTVVAILMWRKVHMVGPNEADKNYSFRVLQRISKMVCPLLLLSAVSAIVFDVVGNLIINGVISDDYVPFVFADDFTSGAIVVLLNLAIISVGYAL